MDQKSHVLIGKKRKEHNLDLKNLWNFCYDKVRSKVWLKRCEFFAELEKERGLEKKDLRKRKEIPTKDKNDDTELDNKYKKREKTEKNLKNKKNGKNEKNDDNKHINKKLKLVTKDRMI
ncbi:hypothetical protein RhiirC2_753452, partial [Rhizophagus irregularis]